MGIIDIINDLYAARQKYRDTTWFDYQGFRWELGRDLCFHPQRILYEAICPGDRHAAQYDHPVPYYPESERECVCESLL